MAMDIRKKMRQYMYQDIFLSHHTSDRKTFSTLVGDVRKEDIRVC
jgi:hypothetical protein